jgi:AcrR family transcriptional regulator
MDNTIKQRTRIAEAFERHFMHFGFKKTTVDDVAAELGSSKKTIYNYFSSKDEIFYFIISSKAKTRREMIEKKIIHLESAKAKMEAMIRINFEEFRKVHKRKAAALDERFQSEIAAGAFREAFSRMVSDIIREGVANKEFEVCDHEMTVRYIQALITETVMKMREDKDAHPEDFLVFTVNKLLNKCK